LVKTLTKIKKNKNLWYNKSWGVKWIF
jgi:hypothetical protein